MSRSQDELTNTELAGAWREGLALSCHIRDYAWMAPLMIGLGLGAALAETLGVSLAVMFLFTVLGQTAEIDGAGGALSGVFGTLRSIVGDEPQAIAATFVAMILASSALVYVYQVLAVTLTNRIAERMRDRVHETYVTVGYLFLQKRERGELVHTLSTDTWIVSEAFFSFARIGVNVCTAVIFAAGLFALSWRIALTALVCGVLLIALQRALARPLERIGAMTLVENQRLSERMLVSLNGMRTLRAFAQEAYVLKVFSAASSTVRQLAIKAERIKALIGPLGEVASLVALVAIVLVAERSGTSIAATTACILLLLRLQPHLREAEGHRLALAGMAASLRSVRGTLDRSGKPWPTQGTRPFERLQTSIRFEDVSFFHDTDRGPSLERVSFEIRQGQTIAISGPSGSGKTTIINLLLRIYEPDGGGITVDGIDLREIERTAWLDRIAIAGQDVELIEGTVAQNVRLAKHDATEAEIEAALAAARILDDMRALKGGLHGRIGPGGLSLSGGQRQRLGLARALVRKPDILILDEATSAMETQLEDEVRSAIASMMVGKTVIVVSHRPSAIEDADCVIRIEHGRIVKAMLAPTVC